MPFSFVYVPIFFSYNKPTVYEVCSPHCWKWVFRITKENQWPGCGFGNVKKLLKDWKKRRREALGHFFFWLLGWGSAGTGLPLRTPWRVCDTGWGKAWKGGQKPLDLGQEKLGACKWSSFVGKGMAVSPVARASSPKRWEYLWPWSQYVSF